MAFPTSPVDGQTSVVNNITYVYSSASNAWTRTATGFVNLSASANISAGGNVLAGGDVIAVGNVSGNYILGNGALLTGVITSVANVTNGNSNVNIATAAGNVTVSVSGVGNVAVFAPTGEYVTGVVSATGDVTGANIRTVGQISALGTVTGSSLLGTVVSASGNITGAIVNTTSVVGSAVTISTTSNGAINLAPNGTGNVIVNGRNINNLADPVQAQDAATKNYVDTVAQGLDTKQSVVYATTASIFGSGYFYNNFGGGVGATLVATSVGNLVIDGNVAAVGQRVLIKNEVGAFVNNNTESAAFNGIYTVTQAGSPSAVYVLTRTADFDINTEIPAAFTFVEEGAVNADTGWVCTTNNPITVGTTSIDFAQFSGAGSFTANTSAGLSLTGTVFSAKVDGVTTAFDVGGNISVKASANLTTPNIGVATGTSLSVTGNVQAGSTVSATGNVIGGNILTAGLVSATGNATFGNVATTGLTGTTVSVTGTVTAASVVGGVITGTSISVTGNTTAGNVLTSGSISATGDITGANLSGALVTGTLTTAAQPNVTSVGTLTSLNSGTISSSGNVTGANLLTGGQVSAAGNITGSNIIGTLVTGTLTTAAQPNVTSVGTLTSLNSGPISSSGNVTAANVLTAGFVSATGNVTGNYIIGDGSLLTNINASNITGGYSNTNAVSLLASFGSNVISTTGTIISGNITGANILTGGLVSATGNITAANFTTTGNITGANVISGNTLNAVVVSASGNVTGNYIIGDGSLLTNINASNITGGYSNTNATSLLASFGSNTINTTGTINSGNITGANILTGGLISATGDITGGNVTATNLTGTLTTATQPNVTSVGTLTSLNSGTISSSGNVTGANILTGGSISATGNATAGNISTAGSISATGNITGGNISTAGIGIVGGLTFSGNNIISSGATITIDPNGTGGSDGNVVIAGNLTVQGTTTTINSNTVTINDLLINLANNAATAAAANGGGIGIGPVGAEYATLTYNSTSNTWVISNGANIIGAVSASGNITGGNVVATNLTGALTTAAQPNVTSVGTLTSLSVSGNTQTGNLSTGGAISATGNITGDYFIGNGSQLTGVAASSVNANALVGNTLSSNVLISSLTTVGTLGNLTVTGNAAAGNILTTGLVSATGNATFGNVDATSITGTTASVSGTVTAASVVGGVITGTSTSVTGNVTGGNVLTAGFVSATGNVSGNYILGNGALLTGVITSVANINSGTSNVTVVSPGGNVTVGIGGVGNVAVFATTGEYITGELSVSGNITSGGNIAAGNLSTTGNIVGGGVRSTSSPTAPANPAVGDFWYNTATNVQYRFTFDGSGYYWIDDFGSTTGVSGTFNAITNGTSSANIATAGGNIQINIGGTNIARFTTSGLENSQANATGNIGNATNYFDTVFAKATSAVYADLAETYAADAEYEPGTLVVFGGTAEITVSDIHQDTRVAGIISTDPAYLMNSTSAGLPVALTGRVPCRVVGAIQKGDRLVTSGIKGVATVLDPTKYQPGCIIGKALENYDSDMVGVIEVAVGRY